MVRAGRAALRPTTPVLAQMVVTRRCNLTCGYCNEYDTFSPPVPTATLLQRIDHLASLGTVILTLTGGEPLLHPDLDKIIAHAVSKGMVTTSITNGFPLTKSWIERLNAARLTLLQVSVDNLYPNEISDKSFSKIVDKLELLRDNAKFSVNVNAVLGSSNKEETRQVVRDVRALGFFMTVGLLHDHAGQIDPGLLGNSLAELYDEMRATSHKSLFHRSGEGWERTLIENGDAVWKCRAGARYLYIDENGVVSYCSQRRGEPGIGILDYGRDEITRAFNAPKGCEARCTLACVRRASAFDGWRAQDGAPVTAVVSPAAPTS